jgi:hypothetical protein
MLKTLDILIGGVTVLLLFSMAVTVLTQAMTTILAKRGKHLLSGLANLLQQLGIADRKLAEEVSTAVLKHPMVASIEGKLATVVHRHEFTTLLLDLGSPTPLVPLSADARSAVQKMLGDNGIKDPAQTLKSIRTMAMMLETSNPEMAGYARQDLAILKESCSDYVARINSLYDQTIDRVSQAFARHAHVVTLTLAFIVVLAVQLDIIAVIDRLSIDDQFRQTIVSASSKAMTDYTQVSAPGSTYNPDPKPYYNLLNSAGLVTLPTNTHWFTQLKDPRKYPGMIIAVLLLSLGAAFWYNILKDLIGLRSALAQNDDTQRQERQSTQTPTGPSPPGTPPTTPSNAPAWTAGERGDLNAAG